MFWGFFHPFCVIFFINYSTVCYYCEDNKSNMKEDRFREEVGINLLRLPWEPQHHAEDRRISLQVS